MTLRTSASYTGLITWQYADRPNYVAVVNGVVQPYVDQQAFLASLPSAFDIDDAVGVQLDITGQWVGPSRRLPVPVQNIFFSFDVPGVGLDQGYWKGSYQLGSTIELLDDDTYRRLLKARILANYGTGTPQSAQEVLSAFFDAPPVLINGQAIGTYVIVQDNTIAPITQTFFSFDDNARGLDGPAVWYQPGLISTSLPSVDMSMTIGIAGANPSILNLEVLVQRLLPVVAAGVRADVTVSSVNGAPLFGFDVSNQYIGGLDQACWGIPVKAFIANRPTGQSS